MRRILRGQAELLFGKKTIMNRVLHEIKKPGMEELIGHVKLNVGFIFTNGEYKPIMDAISATRRKAAAKAGMKAPDDVSIQPVLTTMGPDSHSFFVALNIPTKINKGKIEITQEVHLIKKGTIVTPSHAILL